MFSISGLDDSPDPQNYRIIQYVDKKAQGDKFAQQTTHTISKMQLLNLFPYSRNALTGKSQTLCFGVIYGSAEVSDRLCLDIILQYAESTDPELTACASFYDKLTFGNYQTAVKNANNYEYISTSQETQFHFEPNY